MQILRFFEDNTVALSKGTLKSGVVMVSEIEAYTAEIQSIGFLVKAPYFGFGKVVREPVITTRVGCATPLYPINEDYLSEELVSEEGLKDYENASFLETQLRIEKGSTRNQWLQEKILLVVMGILSVVFGIMVIFKGLPMMRDNLFSKPEPAIQAVPAIEAVPLPQNITGDNNANIQQEQADLNTDLYGGPDPIR
tara:strand:- start:4646 stop:5230 length:585 start_codon:yes stop_codon:yes gene_type:complete